MEIIATVVLLQVPLLIMIDRSHDVTLITKPFCNV